MSGKTLSILALMICPLAHAFDPAPEITRQLGDLYPGAKIEIKQLETSIDFAKIPSAQLQLVRDIGSGVAVFGISAADFQGEKFQIQFTALKIIPIAKKRIYPGERLSTELFSSQQVDLTQPRYRDNRALIVPANTDFNQLESRASVLEGDFPLLSGIQKTPDVRRGQLIKVKVISEGVELTTSAIVQEPGYTNQAIRVLTSSTKKELIGQLTSEGFVEVHL